MEALLSYLRGDTQRFKRSNTLCTFAASLLMYALRDSSNWTLYVLQAFLDDSLEERVWVDDDRCQLFVSNILTCLPDFRDPAAAALKAEPDTTPQ